MEELSDGIGIVSCLWGHGGDACMYACGWGAGTGLTGIVCEQGARLRQSVASVGWDTCPSCPCVHVEKVPCS